MKQNIQFRIVIVAVAVVLSLWALIPTFRTIGMSLEEKQKFAQDEPNTANKAIKLGLDLQGGTHLILEVDKTGLDPDVAKDAADRGLEVIRNRIDQFGVSEPEIRKQGDSRLLVQLAGVAPEQAKGLLSSTAQLEFKIVQTEAKIKTVLQRIDATLGKKAAGKSASKADSAKIDSATVAKDSSATDSTKSAVKTGPDADSLAKAKAEAQAEAARVARELFAGDEVTDTVATADTAAGKTANKTAFERYSERPLTSFLVPYGNGIAVLEDSSDIVKAIIARPEVQEVLRLEDAELLWGRRTQDVQLSNGKPAKLRELYVLKRRAEMKGDYVANAMPTFETEGGNRAAVSLTLKDKGPREFARITGGNIGRQMAIILDGAVFSAPTIQVRIPNGQASITGLADINEAKQLAIVLRAGAMPAPMHIVEERSVGPALGAENIRQGMLATIAGVLAVFLFMFWQYRACGGIANAALILNALFTLAILAVFHATLTLPGIAGIVLTIGMAVDSNVLIYERIREEIRAGRTIRAAVDAGYKRAFSAIIDSHLTTVLTAYALFLLGTGPIRGFGLTLTIGVIVSLFTALTCTRIVFDVWLSRKDRTTIAIGTSIRYFEEAKLNIIGNSRKIGYASAVVGLLILGFILVPKANRTAFNWGIDFSGGVMMTVKAQGGIADEKNAVNEITEALEKEGGLKGVQVRTLSDVAGHTFSVTVKTDSLAGAKAQEFTKSTSESVRSVLAAKGSKVEILSVDTVGPKIGKELKKDAILAAIASVLIIMFYVWFRFGKNGLGFGIASVVTLAHDIMLTLGLLIFTGFEVDMTVIAAVLTLIGYSLIDSIVIFDRIRENASKYRKEDFEVLVNNSINETLSRTMMTSVTTGLVTLMLAIFGGPTLQNFAIVLTFGIVVGTYSSLAISAPAVVLWVKRRGMQGIEGPKAMPRAEMRVGQAPSN
ncbi:MAG: protein translocase subunit SecD [Fibrobacterota bacterium]|nr:protein translocase subunit SecD [Fibrobacterota bacterium]QQS07467.1 MAG: protein translocase subunit SecD [Fibrobacterota bacterium]